jgi:hypothetical protein
LRSSPTPGHDEGTFGEEIRIFTGDEIDCAIPDMAQRYPHVSMRDLKKACYANRIYEWLRCGYAHNYWETGNTTYVPPSDLPAQISYMARREPDGTRARIASFHLDYLIDVAQDQVSRLPKKKLDKPDPVVDRPNLTNRSTATRRVRWRSSAAVTTNIWASASADTAWEKRFMRLLALPKGW